MSTFFFFEIRFWGGGAPREERGGGGRSGGGKEEEEEESNEEEEGGGRRKEEGGEIGGLAEGNGLHTTIVHCTCNDLTSYGQKCIDFTGERHKFYELKAIVSLAKALSLQAKDLPYVLRATG